MKPHLTLIFILLMRLIAFGQVSHPEVYPSVKLSDLHGAKWKNFHPNNPDKSRGTFQYNRQQRFTMPPWKYTSTRRPAHFHVLMGALNGGCLASGMGFMEADRDLPRGFISPVPTTIVGDTLFMGLVTGAVFGAVSSLLKNNSGVKIKHFRPEVIVQNILFYYTQNNEEDILLKNLGLSQKEFSSFSLELATINFESTFQ